MKFKHLICSVCGGEAYGVQHWNQDNGYGICDNCVKWVEEREGKPYIQECYGKYGTNHSIKTKEKQHDN